ncbi:uncharacterized protein LOC131220955 [Magnolia sinica]|uniref:uncharacterized protein LOC131220955 n=1 Tax=Magnolia sinica TaxID=86752 RepID=UPI002658DEEA|nr:uncharacterized protein LOC131220955 [Magnolia sinica]XP_058071978.1 uncharacterized protein LOC131220955 [Magnolia sinica]XP_058071986.1 uncharacterized protein LOC131220955 [Magnolia sinica]
MASSLSRRFSTKLLKPSLSSSPLSYLFSNHFISQNPNPNSSVSQHSFPTFSGRKPINPTSDPSAFFSYSSDSTTLYRFPTISGVESINPNLNFLRSFSTSPAKPNPQNLSQQKPTNPNRNLSNPYSNSPQTPLLGKPKSHIPSFIRSYSSFNAAQSQTTSHEKHTNSNPHSFRSFASSTQTPSEAKSNGPDPNLISSSSSSSGESDSGKPQNPEFQHQEIVGPTVERDVSALAEETRQVLQNLKKTIYDLSRVVALLGLVQLSCGAWIAHTTQSSLISEISIQSFVAFAFPFSLAFLLRQTLKPMSFFRKMEEQGRLQILTLALQVSKCLNLFFLRARVISFMCVVGMSIGLLFTTLSR